MSLYTQTNPNPKIVRTRASSPTRHQPIRQNPSGSHIGGTCNGCGRALTHWFHYQLCDACLGRTRVDAPTY